MILTNYKNMSWRLLTDDIAEFTKQNVNYYRVLGSSRNASLVDPEGGPPLVKRMKITIDKNIYIIQNFFQITNKSNVFTVKCKVLLSV